MTAQYDNGISEVSTYLAAQDDLRLGVLFGSLAHGTAAGTSDLDLAVVGERPLSAKRRIELIENLARITGRAVDLVDLATAGVAVMRSALLEGRVLFCRDNAVYPDQVSRMLLDSADILPYRERLLRERREAWMQ